jgi:magnesium chelatase subunit I
VARELIREAVGEVFSVYLGSADLKPVIAFFEAGGSLKIREEASSEELLALLRRVPGLMEQVGLLGVTESDPPGMAAAAAEFVLEGLYAQKKVGRTDDRGFIAPDRRSDVEVDLERLERMRRMKKQVN